MRRSFPPSPLTAPMSIVLVAALAGCAAPSGSAPAGGGKAAAARADKPPVMWVYGGQGAVPPYTLFVGTPVDLSAPVPQNGTGALDAGAIRIEPARVGDAPGAKFTWTGGPGQFHLQSKVANDLLAYIDANSAMVFDAVVNMAPQDQVTMRVDCRYPCLGVVDMTDFYKKAPVGRKIEVKVPLTCFEATGTKFAAVNAPLVIFTTQPFSLSVANVRYVPGAAKDADAFRCAA